MIKTRRRIKIKSEISKIEIKIIKIKKIVIETITKIILKTHEIVIVKIDLIVIKVVKTLARDVKIVKTRSIFQLSKSIILLIRKFKKYITSVRKKTSTIFVAISSIKF